MPSQLSLFLFFSVVTFPRVSQTKFLHAKVPPPKYCVGRRHPHVFLTHFSLERKSLFEFRNFPLSSRFGPHIASPLSAPVFLYLLCITSARPRAFNFDLAKQQVFIKVAVALWSMSCSSVSGYSLDEDVVATKCGGRKKGLIEIPSPLLTQLPLGRHRDKISHPPPPL